VILLLALLATHGIGNSNVANGSFDALTLHQDSIAGASCWQVMNRTRNVWVVGHEGEDWLMSCGGNDAIADIPVADSAFAIVQLEVELAKKGSTLCYVTPPSLSIASPWKATVDTHVRELVLLLPAGLCLIDAHRDWIVLGYDQMLELYQVDGGHLSEAGNAKYTEIVSAENVPLGVTVQEAIILLVVGFFAVKREVR